MSIAYPFVYGRSRSVDYRWLQPPEHALRQGFFANLLESCNHRIARGERFCFAGLDERASVFSLSLSWPDLRDQRGRPIGFVLGYTVAWDAAREFAFRLPDLLLGHTDDQLLERYGQAIRRVVDTDGAVRVPPFNPFDFELLRPRDNRSLALKQWAERVAGEMRLRIDTPRIVSNFDASHLGTFIDERFAELEQTVAADFSANADREMTRHRATPETVAVATPESTLDGDKVVQGGKGLKHGSIIKKRHLYLALGVLLVVLLIFFGRKGANDERPHEESVETTTPPDEMEVTDVDQGVDIQDEKSGKENASAAVQTSVKNKGKHDDFSCSGKGKTLKIRPYLEIKVRIC